MPKVGDRINHGAASADRVSKGLRFGQGRELLPSAVAGRAAAGGNEVGGVLQAELFVGCQGFHAGLRWVAVAADSAQDQKRATHKSLNKKVSMRFRVSKRSYAARRGVSEATRCKGIAAWRITTLPDRKIEPTHVDSKRGLAGLISATIPPTAKKTHCTWVVSACGLDVFRHPPVNARATLGA